MVKRMLKRMRIIIHTCIPTRFVRHRAHWALACGLAGSGAVVVLLVAASTQLREQISYLVAFGVGTIAGMSLVSMMTGVAANAAAQRHHRAGQWIRVGAACVSVVIGVMLGAEVVRGM